MEIEWAPVRAAEARDVWRDVLCPVAEGLRASARELAARATAAMQADAPESFPDPESVTESRISAEANIRLIAEIIELGRDPRSVPLPEPTLAVGRSGAYRQVPFGLFLRRYRQGHEVVWQWIFDRIVARCTDAGQQARALDLASRWLFAYIDASVTRAEKRYEVEREAWLSSAAATRAEAVAAILDGSETDARLASVRLRYELNRSHLGVIVWVDVEGGHKDPQSVLNEAIALLADAHGADSTLTHPLGEHVKAAWLSRGRPAAEDAVVSPIALPEGVRAAIGEPARQIDGFRRTYLEAGHARRVAMLMGEQGAPVVRYRDVAVAALACADPEHAQMFVTRVLGQLAADDEATMRIATTVAAYIDESRNRARVAERLIVHPNTVSYRVRQAETILGRSIDVDTLELRVALALLPVLRGLA